MTKGEDAMIGDIFRQEREKKQITLKDVESETNIRTLYLEAIEKGDYDVIHGEVYLKGFIKTYAKFLGLDYKDILNKYYEEKGIANPTTETSSEKQQPTSENTASDLATDLPSERNKKEDNSFHQRVEDNRGKRNLVNIVFAVIIAVIVIGCIAYFIVPLVTSPAAPAKNVSQTQAPAPTEQQATPAAAPQPVPDGVHVEATFNDKCWVEVKVDGKTALEQTVDKGANFKWDGQQEVQLVLGNAGAAKVVLNGKDLGSLGTNGAVVTKKFTKDKVEDVKK